MLRQNQVLKELLEPVITAMGYELWGIEELSGRHGLLVRVYIDREEGIDLADCEKVSHQVTGILDVEDPIKGTYNLEISSPGLDRPLFTCEQFGRYVGAQATITLKQKFAGRVKIKGVIKSVSEENIRFLDREKEYDIPVSLIDTARIVPEF